MKLIKTKNYNEMSKKATEVLIEDIQKKPNLVICFASGKTPLGLYNNLVKSYKKNKLDFSKVKAFNLDEYYPLKKTNPKSFYYYLFKNLFNKINIKKGNITLLNGDTKDPEKECKTYENKVKNKIDLAILGVAPNGHIAFNEPGSGKNSKTRLITLSPETIEKNKIKESQRGLTIGIKTILSSKRIILLASGENKAEAIKHLVKTKPNPEWPVTFLKKHKNLIVILDKEAAKLL